MCLLSICLFFFSSLFPPFFPSFFFTFFRNPLLVYKIFLSYIFFSRFCVLTL